LEVTLDVGIFKDISDQAFFNDQLGLIALKNPADKTA